MRVKDITTIFPANDCWLLLEVILTDPGLTLTPWLLIEVSIESDEIFWTPALKASLDTVEERTLMAIEKVVDPSLLRVVVTDTETRDGSILKVSAKDFFIEAATVSAAVWSTVLSTVAVIVAELKVGSLGLLEGVGVGVGWLGSGLGVGAGVEVTGLTEVVQDDPYQIPFLLAQ